MRIRMIVVGVVTVFVFATGIAAAATFYTGLSSQRDPVSLTVSHGAVTLFELRFHEYCRDGRGHPTGSIPGRYAHLGRLALNRFGRFSHWVRERGLLTAQRSQRFNVTIWFGGTVHGRSADGTFRGAFRFFSLNHRFVASCTTGTINWSSHTG